MENITCQVCGIAVLVKKYRVKTAKYCSIKCQGVFWKGKIRSVDTLFKKGQIPVNKGKKSSIESRLKMRFAKFKGGWIEQTGYKVLRDDNRKIVKEHRLVWENYHGAIPKGYVVHHKNEIKTDNRINNLELIKHEEHTRLHTLQRIKDDDSYRYFGVNAK